MDETSRKTPRNHASKHALWRAEDAETLTDDTLHAIADRIDAGHVAHRIGTTLLQGATGKREA